MIQQLGIRGPDSAGVAIYRDPVAVRVAPRCRCTRRGRSRLGRPATRELEHAFGAGEAPARARQPRRVHGRDRRGRRAGWLGEHHPELRVMSAGAGDRDLQGGGPARRVRTPLRASPSSAARTRSATPGWRPRAASRPSTRTRSRPGSTSASSTTARCPTTTACGAMLRREGIRFRTDNDTEVAAGYLTWRLREGATLEQALEGCLDDARRLLHVRGRHARRVRGAARPDRVQAGGDGRDRRMGRDGLGVPRDRGAARAPPTRTSGSRSRGGSTAGGTAAGRLMADDAVAARSRRSTSPAKACASSTGACTSRARQSGRPRRACSTRAASTPSRSGSTPTSRSRSTATSATTAPA